MNKIIIPLSIIIGLIIIGVAINQSVMENRKDIRFGINELQKQIDILKLVTEGDQGVF